MSQSLDALCYCIRYLNDSIWNCSVLSVIREMRVKVTMKYHHTHIPKPRLSVYLLTGAFDGENIDKIDHLYISLLKDKMFQTTWKITDQF